MLTKEDLVKIPKLFETEDILLKDKIIRMHFLIGGCDWYIAEYGYPFKPSEKYSAIGSRLN
jgi:hypothetical protein